MVTITFLVILLACASFFVTDTKGDEDVRRKVPHISAPQALALYQAHRLIPIDVHPGDVSKVRSTILGALYIPAPKLKTVKLNFPKEILLGIFCN